MSEYLFGPRQKSRRLVKWKIYLTVVACLVLVIGILVGAFYLHPSFGFSKGKVDLCLTESCLKASISIVSTLSLSQDPCQDFYEFACERFIEKTYEDDNPTRYDLQRLAAGIKVNDIVAEPVTGEEDSLLLKQKTFFQSCNNVDAIDGEGFGPLYELLEELGGWPVVKGQDWKEEEFELSDIIVKCRELGFSFQWFFSVSLDNDLIKINPPETKRYYEETYKESTYLNLMTETAISIGALREIAQGQMKKALNLEKKIENISRTEENIVLNFAELSDVFPAIPWFLLLNNITDNYTNSEEDPVMVSSETYLRGINILLAGTPKRDQANFIIWKIIQEFGFYLPKPIRENFLCFTNFMVPPWKQVKSHFEFCIKDAIEKFPHVAETEYFRRYMDEEKKDTIKEIISKIKEQFIKQLTSIDWLDEESKNEVISTIKDIVVIIDLDSLEYLDGKYEMQPSKLTDLEFTTNSLFGMAREKKIFETKRQFTEEKFNYKDEFISFWFSKIFEVNVGYNSMHNAIFLGVMEDNIFGLNRPNYLNYASFGSAVSHEIARALVSSIFSGYSVNQEEQAELEWSSSTLQAISYEDLSNITTQENATIIDLFSKMNCIIRNFEESDEIKSEELTDLLSVDIAYEAYVSWAEQYEEEQRLPNLPFSVKQLFWIQSGIMNCYRHLDIIQLNPPKSSLPFRQRVLNPMKNSKNFAKPFECPDGSIMNPIEKCILL